MTTTFNYQRKYTRTTRKQNEPVRISLFSPFALLILLALVFTFFITASNEPAYLRTQGTESMESSETTQRDPVVIYQKLVTSADAIRSVLQ